MVELTDERKEGQMNNERSKCDLFDKIKRKYKKERFIKHNHIHFFVNENRTMVPSLRYGNVAVHAGEEKYSSSNSANQPISYPWLKVRRQANESGSSSHLTLLSSITTIVEYSGSRVRFKHLAISSAAWSKKGRKFFLSSARSGSLLISFIVISISAANEGWVDMADWISDKIQYHTNQLNNDRCLFMPCFK